MGDYEIEALMLYGALGGAATNLVVVSGFGLRAGALVMIVFASSALAFDVWSDS